MPYNLLSIRSIYKELFDDEQWSPFFVIFNIYIDY